MIVVSIILLLLILVSGGIIFVWTCYALFCIRQETFDGKTLCKERRRTKEIVGERLQNQVNIYKSYCDHLAMQAKFQVHKKKVFQENLINCKPTLASDGIFLGKHQLPTLVVSEEIEKERTCSDQSESDSDEEMMYVIRDRNM